MQVIFNYIDAKFPTLVRKLDLIQSRISCNINPIYILLFLKSSFPRFFENCAFYLEIVSNAWTRQFSMGEDEKIVYDIFALCFCNTCCTFEKKVSWVAPRPTHYGHLFSFFIQKYWVHLIFKEVDLKQLISENISKAVIPIFGLLSVKSATVFENGFGCVLLLMVMSRAQFHLERTYVKISNLGRLLNFCNHKDWIKISI